MLNELCDLSAALEQAGIIMKEWHPQLKPLPNATPKKPCYHIWINPDNSFYSIDVIDILHVSYLRKWEPNNGNSFPGFNIYPLYRITDEQIKAKITELKKGKAIISIDELRSWCSEQTNNWDDNTWKKIGKCLHDIPLALLAKLDKENGNNNAIEELIDRSIRYVVLPQNNNEPQSAFSFRAELETFIWTSFSQNEGIKILLPLLIYEGDSSKKPEDDKGPAVSIFLDISDWKRYSIPVAHEKNIVWLNEQLIGSNYGIQSDSSGFDAYGLPLYEKIEKFPSVKLPIIADVKLRSMFNAHHCQYRYNTIEGASFPVGKDSSIKAKGALEWLSNESRKNITWGQADAKELLFAYPSILPAVPIPMAKMFGTRQTETESQTRFGDISTDVIHSLQGISKDLKSLNIKVFALKKMDKARTKVVFYRNYSARRLQECAEFWQWGCMNLPQIQIRTWREQKGTWEIKKPIVPFPLEISNSLNRVWKHDGSSEYETPTIKPTQGIELLLSEHPEQFTGYLLSVLLQNSLGLFLYTGNQLHMGHAISTMGINRSILLIPSILGLLLFKLGISKEDYVENAPFLIGRLLNLSDELHAFYCQEVRDDKLPSQLIGNSLMTAALNNPTQILAQLGQRLVPYIAWAKQFRTQEKDTSWKAGWLLKLFEETMTALKDLALPSRCADAEKAQLIIGYLSSLPRKQEISSSLNANVNHSNERSIT